MSRRRRKRALRVGSEMLESQGEGTWVEIPKRLSTEHHLGPAMTLLRWRSDPRLTAAQAALADGDTEGLDGDAMQAVLREMEADFAQKLFKSVVAWNWVTDCEAELAEGDGSPVVVDEEGRLRVQLATPIWAGSLLTTQDGEGHVLAPVFVESQPVYLGNYPDDCTRLRMVGISEDGLELVLGGSLGGRELVPGEDWVIVGYPDPDSPEALGWGTLEELTFICEVVSEHFNTSAEKRRSKGPKARR